ncbi:MAG: carbonic anhydrase family protein [Planctomycetaceae bacterium]
MITDYENKTAPARNISVSLLGFRRKYQIQDRIQYVDFSSRDVQEKMTPAQTLQVLLDGNERFRTGNPLQRNLHRQMESTAGGQHPLAVVLTCIDSRTPAELIFDMGLGDLFSVRIAGNIVSAKVLGSMEYGCARAGSKLVLVVGHTRCGAVTSTVQLASEGKSARDATGCEHLDAIVRSITPSIDETTLRNFPGASESEQESLVDQVARNNVLNTIERIREHSTVLRELEAQGQIAIVGAMYNVSTGEVEVITQAPLVGAAKA